MKRRSPSPSRFRRFIAGLVAAVVSVGGAVILPMVTAPAAHATPSYGDFDCGTGARMFQIRAGGSELWYASVGNLSSSSPTYYNWRKIYDFSSTRPALAVAAHSYYDGKITLFVTDTNGGLRSYRYYVSSGDLRDATNLRSPGTATSPAPYKFSRLTSDGSKLYGVKDGYLHVMTTPTRTAEPRGRAQVEYIGTVRSFWGNGGYDQEVGFTDSSGRLRYLNVYSDSSGWHTYNAVVRSSGWEQRTITSPGGGMLIRGVPAELWRHIVDMPTQGTATDITAHNTIDNVAQVDAPVSTVPTVCSMATTNNVVNLARLELGVEEGPEADRYFDWNPDWAGDSTYSVAWCAAFVSYVVYRKAGVTSAKSRAVGDWVYWARHGSYNLSVTTSPRPGDLVAFDWEGDGDYDIGQRHIGIVEQVGSGGTFYTIEGNTTEASSSDEGVHRRTRSTGSGYNVIFIRIS